MKCPKLFNPLSVLLTYTYMSWYYLWENLHKIGSNKDLFITFFWFACCFAKEPTGNQTENIATIFHTKNNTPFRWKRKKTHQTLSTVGSSFDLNVSNHGVNRAFPVGHVLLVTRWLIFSSAYKSWQSIMVSHRAVDHLNSWDSSINMLIWRTYPYPLGCIEAGSEKTKPFCNVILNFWFQPITPPTLQDSYK